MKSPTVLLKTALVVGLVVALALPIAYALGRGGRLRCRHVGAGTVTAVLQWTKPGSPGPEVIGTDTWSCTDNTTDAHDTVQPNQATDWHLTITITNAAGTVLKTCMFNDPLFFAGHPQNFTKRCDPAGEAAQFKLGRPEE